MFCAVWSWSTLQQKPLMSSTVGKEHFQAILVNIRSHGTACSVWSWIFVVFLLSVKPKFNGPARMAQWTHELVVESSIPRWGELSVRRFFRLWPLLKHVRKVAGGFGKKKLYKYWCEKARKPMCVTDHHDMTLAASTHGKLTLEVSSIDKLFVASFCLGLRIFTCSYPKYNQPW